VTFIGNGPHRIRKTTQIKFLPKAAVTLGVISLLTACANHCGWANRSRCMRAGWGGFNRGASHPLRLALDDSSVWADNEALIFLSGPDYDSTLA
jgi:hypothetical protein